MTSDICLAHGGDMGEPSGGTDRVTAIASGLLDDGYDVSLVIPDPSDELSDTLSGVSVETVSVATHGVSTQPKRAYKIARRAQQVTRREDAFLQFEHSTLAGVGTFSGDEPFVVDMHDFAFQSPLYGDLPLGSLVQRFIRYIETRAVNRARHIFVVSGTMKELVCTEWGLPDEKVSVVPNGYFEDRIAEFRDLSPVDGRVTFLGTLHPKLDAETFVEIAELPTVHELVVIGDANKREELERASESVPALRVTGRLPDEEAFRLVGTSELALNPQHPSELQAASCPVKLAYYAALGIPAVVTAGPDLADWLADRGCVEVVKPGGDFVRVVNRVLSSEGLRDEMAASAREAAGELTWSHRVADLSDGYVARFK
jgi:glycosyltransferase involved in cell wall biosynthesis